MDSIWIFGYGSLVYRPGFEHAEAVEGYIRGYRRVFYQGSTDHRGTPEAPGRTVTLVPDPAAVTWGVAFRLVGSLEQQQETLAYLEWREKQYDKRIHADIYTRSSSSSSSGSSSSSSSGSSSSSSSGSSTGDVPAVRGALMYIATDGPQNVNWLGPAPLADIARQAAAAVGPSGPNYEYIFRLADAMRRMGVEDAELFQLEAAVRKLLPPAVLQSLSDSGSDVTTAAVAPHRSDAGADNVLRKHISSSGKHTATIQLTASSAN